MVTLQEYLIINIVISGVSLLSPWIAIGFTELIRYCCSKKKPRLMLTKIIEKKEADKLNMYYQSDGTEDDLTNIIID